MVKTCSSCNRTFPLTEEYFTPRKGSKDGFRNQCKECRGISFGYSERTLNKMKIEKIEMEQSKTIDVILKTEYEENFLSLPDIARKYNLDKKFVYKLMKQHNIRIRSRPEAQRTERVLSQKLKGENHPSWKGGRMVNSQGYVIVKVYNHPFAHKNGYILEHRMIIEQYLKENDPNNIALIEVDGWEGKWLSPDYYVHHINEIKDDNRAENLLPLLPQTHTPIHTTKYSYTREELEEFLLDFLKKSETSDAEVFESIYPASKYLYVKEFGLWDNAVNYIINKYKLNFIKRNRLTDDDLLRIMLKTFKTVGRTPIENDLRKIGRSGDPFRKRFGSFENAINYYNSLGVFK